MHDVHLNMSVQRYDSFIPIVLRAAYQSRSSRTAMGLPFKDLATYAMLCDMSVLIDNYYKIFRSSEVVRQQLQGLNRVMPGYPIRAISVRQPEPGFAG